MMQFLDNLLNRMDSILQNLDLKNLDFEIMDAILDVPCKTWSHIAICGLQLGRLMHNMAGSLDDSCKTWAVSLDVCLFLDCSCEKCGRLKLMTFEFQRSSQNKSSCLLRFIQNYFNAENPQAKKSNQKQHPQATF